MSDRGAGARARSAQRTRIKVIEAAAVLFAERGYGRTSLQAIADLAGVSVETVGLAGPKRLLLRQAFDMAFAGSSASFPASGDPAYIRLTEELGFEEAVAEYVRMLASSIARTSGLWSAFQAAADADPAAEALFAELRATRRREFARTAQWLADRGVIAEEGVAAMVEQFFLNASHETYLLLASECAYTVEDFAARLMAQVSDLLAAGSTTHPVSVLSDRNEIASGS